MLSIKKILLLGFVIVLLVAIPLTIYFVSQQQKSKNLVPSTRLSLTPNTQSINLGSDANFDINIDPGLNSVSFVKILISYDATKLATDGAGFISSGSFPSLIQGPTYGPGTISVTLSLGANAPPINKPAKIGTLTFKTITSTDTAPTQITFGNQTQVLTAGTTDQFNENVLSTTSPASINIIAEAPIPTPTTASILTPTPATALQSNSSTTSSNQIATASPAQAAEAPVCLSFTADRALTGIAPFNVNFTLIGTSSATAVKATFNFGDGQITNLTQVDGIGQTSVNALTSHIYNSSGSFSAFGTITDANGAISQVGTCTVILTINPSSTSTAQITPYISPLPPTGPNNIFTIGAMGVLLVVIGVVLLFAL